MKNIILEGANATGKTTAMNFIRGVFPESNFIEFHDFFHEHTINQFGLAELFEKRHWSDISKHQVIETDLYLKNRTNSILEFIACQRFNRNIIERLFLTHGVYSQMLFDLDISDYISEVDYKFSLTNTVLILVTCDDSVMKTTLEDNISKRTGRNAPTSQFHLKSVEIGLLKNGLYQRFFNNITHMEKVMIVNDGLGVENLNNKIISALRQVSA